MPVKTITCSAATSMYTSSRSDFSDPYDLTATRRAAVFLCYSRACRDAVQGGRSRSRDAGAGETTPTQSLAAWQEFARQYFPALAQRPAVVHGGGVLLPVAFVLSRVRGLDAVWWAFPIAELFAVTLSALFLRRVFRRSR